MGSSVIPPPRPVLLFSDHFGLWIPYPAFAIRRSVITPASTISFHLGEDAAVGIDGQEISGIQLLDSFDVAGLFERIEYFLPQGLLIAGLIFG